MTQNLTEFISYRYHFRSNNSYTRNVTISITVETETSNYCLEIINELFWKLENWVSVTVRYLIPKPIDIQ